MLSRAAKFGSCQIRQHTVFSIPSLSGTLLTARELVRYCSRVSCLPGHVWSKNNTSTMKMVELYGFIASPPLRASMMTCEAVGVEYKLNFVNVLQMDHHKPEYLELNPLHSIPTLVDGDYVLFDSHAISSYLVNAYGKDDKWYPKEPRLRGLVDQRLHFDNGILGPAFKNLGVPVLFGKQPHPRHLTNMKEALQDLDKLLGDRQFIALNWPTIADCHCSSSALSAECVMPDIVPPRVSAWLRRCEQSLPGFEKVHSPAVEQVKAMFSSVDLKTKSKL